MSENMTEQELKSFLIDSYTSLQRIKSAPDKDKELEYQIKIQKAKLEALGVSTTDLNIDD